MNSESIYKSFQKSICSGIDLVPEGINRYRILSDFTFQDGDHLAIVLKRENNEWILSDEGHTLMHLSYRMDINELLQGKRGDIIENNLSYHYITNRDGEFIHVVKNEEYGHALFEMIQGLIRINDLSFLSREFSRDTFIEDVLRDIELIPELSGKFIRNWHNAQFDPDGQYPADGFLPTQNTPIVLFILPNDKKVLNATINLLQYAKWGLNIYSIGIFENQEKISRKTLAKYSDISDKQYSNYPGNREKIHDNLVNAVVV
jgi:hypothetical protein